MSRQSLKNALGASLDAETDAFKSRFERAEARLGNSEAEFSAPETQFAPVPRVVREAFTIPETEHGRIEEVRTRMLGRARAVTKSETLRAGLLLLSELSDAEMEALFDRLEKVKTGRPKL